jgi:hypothetical protein
METSVVEYTGGVISIGSQTKYGLRPRLILKIHAVKPASSLVG